MGYLATFLAFNLIIFIHEMGHLWVARWGGIAVSEFSIGMGPRLFHFTIRSIRYSWRLFPIGGSVQIVGMGDEDEIAKNGTSYRQTSVWRRFLAVIAGSGANILLGFLVFLVLFSVVGILSPTTKIQSIRPHTPASESLQVGDVILAMNGKQVTNVETDLIAPLQAWGRRPLNLTIQRQGDIQMVSLTPIQQRKRTVIGVEFGLQKIPGTTRPLSVLQHATMMTWHTSVRSIQSIYWLITGAVSLNDVTGVVGMVQVGAYGYNSGLVQFLSLLAVISIGLGVVNLLPLPVLDGGHVVLLALEAIRKKPLPLAIENKIASVFFALLMGLMVLFLFSDIRLWNQRHQQFSTNRAQP